MAAATPLTDAEVSHLTGIMPKSIPRSRVKLWYLDLLSTQDFTSFSFSSGSQLVPDDIKFSDENYGAALTKFKRDKLRFLRGSGQQVLFDEDGT